MLIITEEIMMKQTQILFGVLHKIGVEQSDYDELSGPTSLREDAKFMLAKLRNLDEESEAVIEYNLWNMMNYLAALILRQ